MIFAAFLSSRRRASCLAPGHLGAYRVYFCLHMCRGLEDWHDILQIQLGHHSEWAWKIKHPTSQRTQNERIHSVRPLRFYSFCSVESSEVKLQGKVLPAHKANQTRHNTLFGTRCRHMTQPKGDLIRLQSTQVSHLTKAYHTIK